MKKRLFSGIQPSGNLHLGNYLGAMKQWTALQDEHEAIFCIVDLHAITVPQDPAELRKKTLEVAKMYLAAGIDPEKATLFVQSQVEEHTELAWILNTITKNGDLTKMTQLKDKSGISGIEVDVKDEIGKEYDEVVSVNHREAQEWKERFNSVGVGLFDYPVLMAADILLYDTAVVPVGDDQLQHVELARTLARRFNERFGETFVVPEGKIEKEGSRIMGLDNPTKKMSKSAASEYNYIALTDDAETVRRKIKKAVTDSGSEIVYADDKPALRNLITIYSLFSGKTSKEIEAMYTGKGYSDFKTDLAETIVNFLTPFQERLKTISDEEVLAVLKTGATKARTIAVKKMQTVREKIGLLALE